MKPSPISLINTVRGFEVDHEPNGWPAVRMEFLTDMANEIQSAQIALVTARAKTKELTQDFKKLAKRNSQLSKEWSEEIAKVKIWDMLQRKIITDLELRLAAKNKGLTSN
jgi:predicted transcriptional regulator